MDLSGEKGLLDRELVAFFASRDAEAEAMTLARKWAHSIARSNKVVISGFHSPIEREVYRILDAYHRPVVVALARSLYRKIPPIFDSACRENRVLFVSLRDTSRTSFSTAHARNWYVADIASEVVFAPFRERSSLAVLHYTLCVTHSTKVSVLE